MNPFAIPQTLIIPADTAFGRICDVLEGMGFTQEDSGTVTAPLIDGEPEIANWSWYGELPIVQYSFNPVVRLRLLEVATVPPEMRADIAQALSPMPSEAVRDALRADDERRRLFGIWAAMETERIDLIQAITALRAQVSGVILDEVDNALHRLGDLADARLEMLGTSRMVAESALELIHAMRDVEILREMLPTRADCAAAFHESIVDGVWQGFQARTPPERGITCQPETAEDITAMPAGGLRWENELSRRFVLGYRHIAGWMEPSRIWLRWIGTEPDGGVREMDGLVFVNERWVWMPKVFRVVEPLILQPPQASGVLRH